MTTTIKTAASCSVCGELRTLVRTLTDCDLTGVEGSEALAALIAETTEAAVELLTEHVGTAEPLGEILTVEV